MAIGCVVANVAAAVIVAPEDTTKAWFAKRIKLVLISGRTSKLVGESGGTRKLVNRALASNFVAGANFICLLRAETGNAFTGTDLSHAIDLVVAAVAVAVIVADSVIVAVAMTMNSLVMDNERRRLEIKTLLVATVGHFLFATPG